MVEGQKRFLLSPHAPRWRGVLPLAQMLHSTVTGGEMFDKREDVTSEAVDIFSSLFIG